ncbi:hypothetical protein NL676_007166 [Syzygium grande]|nr:hypothetical protein NL676_007166 [Syzygium grande]
MQLLQSDGSLRDLAKVLGTPPSFSQTYERTFMRKDKSFVSGTAKAVKEKFDEMLASTAGVGGSGSGEGTEGTSPSIEMSQAEQEKLWWQASAAVKKGKVYGLGSSSPGQHEVGRHIFCWNEFKAQRKRE